MKKTTFYIIAAIVALSCMIIFVCKFIHTGNGLWAIFAVLAGGLKVCAIADAVELHQSDDFLDRFYGKGGGHE